MTVAATPSSDTATARMTRVLFIGTGLTGIAFAGLSVSSAINQVPVVEPLWDRAAMILLWGIPTLLAVFAWKAPLSWLRTITIAFMVVYAAGVLSWPLAQIPRQIPDGSQPWVIYLLPMAVLGGALVLRGPAVWVFLVVACVVVGALRFHADGDRSFAVPLQDALFNAMIVTIFVAIVLATLQAARQRDEVAMVTAADAVVAAAVQAQNVERAQVAALTHDDVIATLLAASRSTDVTAGLVQSAAIRALERLDALSTTEISVDGVAPASALVAAIRSTIEELTDGVELSAPPEPDGTIPVVVVRALTEATAEALRNSIRHADIGLRETTRVVTIVMTDAGVTVEIVDDGAGFDLEALSLERFGIRLSIRYRMSLVAGGSARVESTPGAGTRVTLRWQRP